MSNTKRLLGIICLINTITVTYYYKKKNIRRMNKILAEIEVDYFYYRKRNHLSNKGKFVT